MPRLIANSKAADVVALMKFVHTSDWHAGKRWRGLSRLDELASILGHLASIIESEGVELLLHAGDLFDTRNPPAEAEALIYEFFVRLHRGGVRSIVVAGNHDDPKRFQARSNLTSFASVSLLGHPDSSNIVRFRARSGEDVVVAAMPFASPARMVDSLRFADRTAADKQYAEIFAESASMLASAFQPQALNVLVAHCHVTGARLGTSESDIHFHGDWQIPVEAFPRADYVALGHLHRRQQVAGRAVYYSGSPMQLDFGEQQANRGCYLVESQNAELYSVRELDLLGAKELKDLSLNEHDVDEVRVADDAWYRITVHAQERVPDLVRRVKERIPGAVVVRVVLPERALVPKEEPSESLSYRERYQMFFEETHSRTPTDSEIALFQELLAQCEEELEG